jgi:hypothetical protein
MSSLIVGFSSFLIPILLVMSQLAFLSLLLKPFHGKIKKLSINSLKKKKIQNLEGKCFIEENVISWGLK